ncbi:MAG: hypothetical protein US58_C0017G0002 [Candidatus Magasanikbacteria bacterium GW2011_GWA2_37_8]|uniref:Uncharacterized protein n=1 Tax=Candidatus Magasanikbacteria bacterium GW2011_GWA2_37_8 TaxID=1619036 RepID=A0A0G0KIY2_9BACT|nr:MAG: hypothetical protein US58_C0017G0002 [Candidatus Magasanikbacteria bacterium GW2011_GWA2_37_8]
MKEGWLNLVLKLTNLIYRKRESELGRQGWKSITNVFSLVALEIILMIISLPLYLSISSAKATAYLLDKGEYAKIAVDYKLRRILTLTGVGVIFIIWVIKFSFLMLSPQLYGPLRLYSVVESVPLALNDQTLIIQDTNMQTARVDTSLALPVISSLEEAIGGRYRFSGTGTAGDQIVLFLTGNQNIMYVDKIGVDGKWMVEHSQSDLKLSNGIHSVFAFHYEKDRGARSKTTAENYFRVSSSFLEKLSLSIDNLANWSVVFVVIIGVLLTILTI